MSLLVSDVADLLGGTPPTLPAALATVPLRLLRAAYAVAPCGLAYGVASEVEATRGAKLALWALWALWAHVWATTVLLWTLTHGEWAAARRRAG